MKQNITCRLERWQFKSLTKTGITSWNGWSTLNKNYPKLMTTDQMMNHSRMFFSYKDIRLELAINPDNLMKLKAIRRR